MRRTIIESPYAGDVEVHTAYARRCMKDSLASGEAPFLSHLLYTQVLDDTDKEQRKWGIKAGFVWGLAADMVAVYVDYGISPGMEKGIARATLAKQPIEHRRIGKNPYTTPYVARSFCGLLLSAAHKPYLFCQGEIGHEGPCYAAMPK